MNINFADIQSIIVQVEIRMEVWFDFIFQKLNQIKTSVFEIIVVQKNIMQTWTQKNNIFIKRISKLKMFNPKYKLYSWPLQVEGGKLKSFLLPSMSLCLCSVWISD